METQSLFVLKYLAGGVAAVTAVVGALFKLIDLAQSEKERARTKARFNQLWETIRDTGVLQLPEKVIDWFLGLEQKSARTISAFLFFLATNRTARLLSVLLGILTQLPFIYLSLNDWSIGLAIYLLIMTFVYYRVYKQKESLSILLLMISSTLNLFILSMAIPVLLVLITPSVFSPTIAVLIVSSMPILWVGNFLSLLTTGCILLNTDAMAWERMHMSLVVPLFVVSSFFLTISGFILGIVSVSVYLIVELSGTMVLSNLLFDTLTIWATFIILKLTISPKKRIWIPVAIIMDLAVAAFFACASLYFGLLTSYDAITVRETINVLFALTPDGSHYEVGPYFWAMHTTFLPTLVYLITILLTWIAKFVVLPVATLFYRGSVMEKPHQLTAGVFLFLGAVSSVIYFFTNDLYVTRLAAGS